MVPGPELAELVEADADGVRDATATRGGAGAEALRRYFLETKEFGANAVLRRQASRLRGFARRMRERLEAVEKERREAAAAAADKKKKSKTMKTLAGRPGADGGEMATASGNKKGKKKGHPLGLGVGDGGVVKTKKKEKK